MSDQETKDALKEALKEWLNEEMAALGWYAFRTVGAAFLVAVIYFIIKFKGITI